MTQQVSKNPVATAVAFLRATILLLVDEGTPLTFSEYLRENSDDPDGYAVSFTVSIPRAQLGKVIGKQGRMAQAIRTILQAGSNQAGIRFDLDLVESHACTHTSDWHKQMIPCSACGETYSDEKARRL